MDDIKNINSKILIIVFILIGISLAFMYGASARIGERLYTNNSYFFNRQLIYALLSIILILFLSRVNIGFFFRFANIFFLITIISLILVLIPSIGKEINGARRWISLKFINYQPSEIAKITIMIYLSKLLYKKKDYIKDFNLGLLPILIVVGLVFILILFEQDFSTAVIILISCIVLIFIAGASFKHIVYISAIGIPVIILLITSFSHMKARIIGFIKGIYEPSYMHYHARLSSRAIEQGGLYGNGLGIGSYNARIPESHTDFYFPNIVADVGLIGGLAIIFLYFYLFFNIYKLVSKIKDIKLVYLVYGLTFILAYQTLINLGSVLGVLPIAGLPLPFLSYGGNSLISSSIAIAIILSIGRQITKA